MYVHLTKKLAEKLKADMVVPEDGYDEFYSWRANICSKGQQRYLVFMNDACRYVVVLNGLKAKDFSKLPRLFAKTMREVMLADKIDSAVIDRYLSELGGFVYVRNEGRQKTSWLTRASERVWFGLDDYEDNLNLSLCASNDLVGTTGGNDMERPSEMMIELL
jgi:hypothetical protein